MKTRLLIILIMVALLLPVLQVQSQDSQRWSPPELLGDGWWQSIDMDVKGHVHIGWYGSINNGLYVHDLLSYTERDSEGNWSPITDVVYTGDGGYTVRNALASTKDGILHAVFRQQIGHLFASAPLEGVLNAGNWTSPVEISGNGYYVDMTADRYDNLHIVFSGGVAGTVPPPGSGNPEASACAYCQDLFYRRSTDGGRSWSDPYPVSILPNSGSDRMDVFEGGSGRMYITWDEGYDWNVGKGQPLDVRMIYSDDSGETWSEPIILDGGGFVDRRPIQIAMAEMRDGALMAIWRYSSDADSHIYYQISNDVGATWTDPQPIPGLFARKSNDTPLDDYDLLVDRLGTVHAFVVGQQNILSKANATLYDVTYKQGQWTPPERVFYSPDMRPEWPKAVLGLSNDIHLSWFIRGIRENVPEEQQSSTKTLRVYYSHLQGNLDPEPTLEFRPTLTPLPTSTVVMNIEPTVTPFPTLDGIDAGLTTPTRDTYGANVVLGSVFVTGVLCFGIAVIARFWRRM